MTAKRSPSPPPKSAAPAAALLLALLCLSVVASVTFGPVPIGTGEAARILRFRLGALLSLPLPGAEEVLSSPRADIIWNIRLPRALMAAAAGAGLSTSGVVMQAVVRNPLANPYVLGISSGASLGATAAILLGAFTALGGWGVSAGAFLGALLTSFFVFTVAFAGGDRGSTVRLLLAGMAVNAVCSAFTNFIIYTAKDAEGIRTVTFWTMGGLASTTWPMLLLPWAVAAAAILFFLTRFRVLNTLLIGDEAALTLGVDAVRARRVYLVVSSSLTGVIVAACGTIGFVGLIVPHMVRMLAGSDHRRVTLLSALTGAVFLIWCDVAARMVLGNTELPIGVVTSMIGGPFFIWLMLTKAYGFGGD